MRIHSDLGTHDSSGITGGRIIKTEQTPVLGEETVLNGQYVLQLPEGSNVDIHSNSYVLPQDSGSIPFQAASDFLLRYPMYDHILYNFFLESNDVDIIDLSSVVPAPTVLSITPPNPGLLDSYGTSRCKTGRGTGVLPLGVVPNKVCVLPKSGTYYGSVITKNIDLTAYNPTNPGMEEVMMWWKVAKFQTTEDISRGYGATLGENKSSQCKLIEVDQEDSLFSVYVSNDNGVSWYEVNRLEPIDLVNTGTDLRIAFLNSSDEEVYLLGFCLLFPDLP